MSDGTPLELVKFRVIGKPCSSWEAIFSESGGDRTLFRITLWQGYGIQIEQGTDPMIYITQDSAQMRELAEMGVYNPTFAQLLTSTKVCSLSEQGAIDAFNQWLEANRA